MSKMESEGPYTYSGDKFNGSNGFTLKVEWGNGFNVDSVALTKEIVKVANIAYAEGRKSMEKDFRELLEIANDACAYTRHMIDWRSRFDAWKKARGIE